MWLPFQLGNDFDLPRPLPAISAPVKSRSWLLVQPGSAPAYQVCSQHSELFLKARAWSVGENPFLACLYPAIGFSLAHIAPQMVFPAEGGMVPFTISTLFLGLAYGWVTYRTGSARWTAITHSVIGLLAFGEPISISIVRLIFR